MKALVGRWQLPPTSPLFSTPALSGSHHGELPAEEWKKHFGVSGRMRTAGVEWERITPQSQQPCSLLLLTALVAWALEALLFLGCIQLAEGRTARWRDRGLYRSCLSLESEGWD